MLLTARVAFAHAVLCIVFCGPFASRALAQSDYDVEQESSVWLRALVDVRLVQGGSAPSWTDGGPGKLRYGGESTSAGFERETKVVLSQLAIELGATLPWNMRAQAQINLQPGLSDNDQPALIEALVRKEWGAPDNGFGLQAGLMNMPFSLEHVGPAWSPAFTISASALDSWLWEEITLAGTEGEWWHDTTGGLRLGAIVGAGFGADRLGRLLSLRGWALGDGLSGLNTSLPLPSGRHMDIYYEQDDRPAGYTLLSLGDVEERVTVRLGYFNNFGDQAIDDDWSTHFATLGVSFHPHPELDVLAQYLRGEARVLATTNDSDLSAWYAMLSWHRARHRVSARYDSFRVEDVDGGNPTGEDGHGVTFAWFYEIGLRHRIGFEHAWLDSRRAGALVPEPSLDGWQLSYRFRY